MHSLCGSCRPPVVRQHAHGRAEVERTPKCSSSTSMSCRTCPARASQASPTRAATRPGTRISDPPSSNVYLAARSAR